MAKPDIKIVLDIETTGLDYKREKIIEFAALKLEDYKIVEEYQTLVNPNKEIRKSSIDVHGITHDMVVDAPSIEEIMPKILDFIQDYPIVGHNVIFDYSFINQACLELYAKGIDNHRIDTYQMFKEVFPEDISHGLDNLVKKFNIKIAARHRAMGDAKALALAYPILKTLYEEKYRWQLSQIQNVNYMFERYLRIQQTIHTLQSELADIKSVFKVYFEEGGKSLESSGGEILFYQTKTFYSYDFEQLKDIIEEIGAYERAFKINNNVIDRMIESRYLDESVKAKLSAARTQTGETKSVVILKPEKNYLSPALNDVVDNTSGTVENNGEV